MTDQVLLDRARAGDEAAFAGLVQPHRRELHVHCYRMLGSFDDADDALQDTLLAAWRGLAGYQGQASVRTWLYRVATNTCLNLIRTASRRPQMAEPLPASAPAPTGSTEVTWLQPYPDALLDSLPDDQAGPDAPTPAQAQLVRQLTDALTAHDVDAVVALLAQDIRITMPPLPAVWQGRRDAARFLVEVAFRLVPQARFVVTRANRQPALAVYTRDDANGLWRASGLLVLTVHGDQITGLTRFESTTLRSFDLPRILPAD